MSLPKNPLRMATNQEDARDFLNEQRRYRSCFSNLLGGKEKVKRNDLNKPKFKYKTYM